MLCLFASYVCLIHCYNNREQRLSAHGMRICVNNLALLDLFMATHLDSATSGNFPLGKNPKYSNNKKNAAHSSNSVKCIKLKTSLFLLPKGNSISKTKLFIQAASEK